MSLRKRRRQLEKVLKRLDRIEAPAETLERARPALERLKTSLSDPQLEVHASDARFRVVVAGRRFGKTYEALYELLDHALQHGGSLCWYVAPTFQMAKEVAWRELKRMAPTELVAETHATFMTMTLVNGSEIGLRSADNPDSLRGRGLDFVVLDEFAGINPNAWTEVLRPALSDREGRALFITTPRGYDWAYDLWLRGFEDTPGWESWQFTTLEGGRVDEEEVEAARESLDPRTFAQEFEASFENLAGRVYSGFSRELHPDGNLDPGVKDTGAELLVGMDFNVHPMSAVVAVRAGDECHVLDAIQIGTSHTEEMASELRSRHPNRTIVVCPDPSGRQRRTSAVGQTDFTILRRAGFKVRAPSSAPLVVDRINNTQAMLLNSDGRRRVRIHPRAKPLIRSLEGLVYKEGTSQPDKSSGLDHMADALGYLLWEKFNTLVRRKAVGIDFRV